MGNFVPELLLAKEIPLLPRKYIYISKKINMAVSNNLKTLSKREQHWVIDKYIFYTNTYSENEFLEFTHEENSYIDSKYHS